MSRNLLGGIIFDSALYNASVVNEIGFSSGCPLMFQTANSLNNAGENTVSWPRCVHGATVAITSYEKLRDGAFTSRTKNFITYIAYVQIVDGASGSSSCQMITSYGSDPVGAPNGAVAMYVQNTGASQYTPGLLCKIGGVWTGLAISATTYDFDTRYRHWALEVDLGAATPRVRLLRESDSKVWAEEITWVPTASIAAAGMQSCASGNGGATSAKGDVVARYGATYTIERDEEITLTSVDTDILDWHMVSYVPLADVGGRTWDGFHPYDTNACAVADLETMPRGENTYITSSVAGQQLFSFPDCYGDELDIQGVAMIAVVPTDSSVPSNPIGPDRLIMGLGGTVTEYVPSQGSENTDALTSLYAFLPQKPDGAGGASGGAWTLADFNNIEAGVLNTGAHSPAAKVYGFMIQPIGRGWRRREQRVCVPTYRIADTRTRVVRGRR